MYAIEYDGLGVRVGRIPKTGAQVVDIVQPNTLHILRIFQADLSKDWQVILPEVGERAIVYPSVRMISEAVSKSPRVRGEEFTQEGLRYRLRDYLDMAMAGAVLLFDAGQTADEQTFGATRERNGIGFNQYDAQTFTPDVIASFRQTLKTGYWTQTPIKHRAAAASAMPKYAKQLLGMFNAVQTAGFEVAYWNRPSVWLEAIHATS